MNILLQMISQVLETSVIVFSVNLPEPQMVICIVFITGRFYLMVKFVMQNQQTMVKHGVKLY